MIDIKIAILIILLAIIIGLAAAVLTDIKMCKEIWELYKANKKRKK